MEPAKGETRMTLKKGDRIDIYQKPLTREDCEGVGTLIKFDSDYCQHDGEIFEIWLVEFDSEPGRRFERIIGMKSEPL
jgi:hypothetical protein